METELSENVSHPTKAKALLGVGWGRGGTISTQIIEVKLGLALLSLTRELISPSSVLVNKQEWKHWVLLNLPCTS